MKATICKAVGLILVSTTWVVPLAFGKPGDVFSAQEREERHSLLKQAWSGNLNVWVDVDAKGTDKNQVITDANFYQDAVQNAYNAWFKGTARYIRQEKREQEFADIYGRLQQGVRISSDPSRNVDLQVKVLPAEKFKTECGGSKACVGLTKDKTQPVIYVPLASKDMQTDFRKLQKYQADITHEAGHTLGMSEQYPSQTRQNSDRARSSSEWDSRSVMNGGGFGENARISARDGTTLINQLDAEGLSGGGRKGKTWASLDKQDTDRYKDGKRLGSEKENQIVKTPQSPKWSLTTPGGAPRNFEIAKNTRITSLNDIVNAQVKVTKQDAQGRPLEGKDSHGNKVVYSHYQGYTSRMFFAGNNLIAADQTIKAQHGDGYIVQAGINGKIQQMEWQTDPYSGNKKVKYSPDFHADPDQNQVKSFDCKPESSVTDCFNRQEISLGRDLPLQKKPKMQQDNTSTRGPQSSHPKEAKEQTSRSSQKQNSSAQAASSHTARNTSARASASSNSGVLRPVSTRPATQQAPKASYSPQQNRVVGSAYYL